MNNNKEERNITGNNPLLAPYNTPFGAVPYDLITLNDFIPAVKECIKEEEKAIERICNDNGAATFENTIAAFDYSGVRLSVVVCAFNALINSRSYDEILAVEGIDAVNFGPIDYAVSKQLNTRTTYLSMKNFSRV